MSRRVSDAVSWLVEIRQCTWITAIFLYRISSDFTVERLIEEERNRKKQQDREMKFGVSFQSVLISVSSKSRNLVSMVAGCVTGR